MDHTFPSQSVIKIKCNSYFARKTKWFNCNAVCSSFAYCGKYPDVFLSLKCDSVELAVILIFFTLKIQVTLNLSVRFLVECALKTDDAEHGFTALRDLNLTSLPFKVIFSVMSRQLSVQLLFLEVIRTTCTVLSAQIWHLHRKQRSSAVSNWLQCIFMEDHWLFSVFRWKTHSFHASQQWVKRESKSIFCQHLLGHA